MLANKLFVKPSRKAAYRAINVVMLQRNWLLGKRIHEEILGGKDRADYGAEVVKNLSKKLTEIYGKGFNKNNLYGFVSFYKIFPTLSGKSGLLSWSHYVLLIDVNDDEARRWYAHEAYAETWSVRTLRRNIASQYYYRLLQSQDKQPVVDEMHRLTAPMQGDKLEFVKNQQHIQTDMGDFYIDLVFYNYILKCFMLIDLKTTQVRVRVSGIMWCF